MPSILAALLILTGAVFASDTQAPPPLTLMPIGQLDGPQLRRMIAAPCGPYATLTPTDAIGGGLLHIGIVNETGDVQIATVPLGAVRLQWCANCAVPLVTVSGDESELHVDLALSREDLKMSPCLQRLKKPKS